MYFETVCCVYIFLAIIEADTSGLVLVMSSDRFSCALNVCPDGLLSLFTSTSLRVRAMEGSLRLMGMDVSVLGDSVRIKGGRLRGVVLNLMEDHGVAMAPAVAGAEGRSTTLNAECVSKSYPNSGGTLRI